MPVPPGAWCACPGGDRHTARAGANPHAGQVPRRRKKNGPRMRPVSVAPASGARIS
ncbi:hypothetical protein L490_1622 [Bordetella bronchiseptica 00-P-2796]|uniref:Uncharacterized protein n=1 Tax=Bordetella bronchiseptica 00-P-2796 TaxID=1331199 RepID=A0ABR4RDK1_BORBO|nr:hypothetical protein L490_1622 [Bordetella bronchiseptica 00-P-2796]